MPIFLLGLIVSQLTVGVPPLCSEQEIGPFLTCDSNGKMVSAPDHETGAKIADFSRVGFAGGNQKLPLSSHFVEVKPSGHDDTEAIQAAIEQVGKLEREPGQLRGVVYLPPGEYHVSSTIKLDHAGVSLDGAGPKATIIRFAGHATTLFQIGGAQQPKATGQAITCSTPTPSGAATLQGIAPGSLKPGDTVVLSIPHNLAWLKLMWGGHYPPSRDGKPQGAWGKDSFTTLQIKTVAAVGRDSITFTTPITDPIPAKQYLEAPATLRPMDVSGLVDYVGVRHLTCLGKFIPGIVDPKKQLTMAAFDNVQDAWLDDVDATDFGISFAQLGKHSRRITVQDMLVRRTGEQEGGAKPFDFSLGGTEALVQSVRSDGNKTFYVATQSQAPGPNVVYNSQFIGGGTIEPHQRWATGLLLDNVSVPMGGIAFIDRASAGSGHGWSIGYGAAYNCEAGTERGPQKTGMDAPPGFTINQPPGAANWGMGLLGARSKRQDKNARVMAEDALLEMPSLFYRQRFQALGPAGLKSLIGPYRLMDASTGECLAARPHAGAKLTPVACGAQGDQFEITSYGNVRVHWSDFCLDVADWQPGHQAVLAPCEMKASQAFSVNTRSGAKTMLQQKAKRSRQVPNCLLASGLVGACPSGGDVRVVPSSIPTH